MLEYHVAYYQNPEDDGWYVVQVLDFPGVLSQGRTLNSARRMIKDALREMVAWHMEDGQPLPLPQRGLKDKKAIMIETIRVTARVEVGTKS
jgi:predicted RNase H-like HicB family nuclease